MVSETQGLIGEEIFIIGAFGQLVLDSNHISQQLVLLIVNLELKVYLFGKQSSISPVIVSEITNHRDLQLIRDITANSIL